VIEADNRRALAERGVVIYLATSIDQQLERTRHGRHRPLLNDTDPEQKLQELMQRRAVLYAEIADFTISTMGGGCSSWRRKYTTSFAGHRFPEVRIINAVQTLQVDVGHSRYRIGDRPGAAGDERIAGYLYPRPRSYDRDQ